MNLCVALPCWMKLIRREWCQSHTTCYDNRSSWANRATNESDVTFSSTLKQDQSNCRDLHDLSTSMGEDAWLVTLDHIAHVQL